MAYQKYHHKGVRVLKYKVKPEEIAEEFLIHELIKMFPEAEQAFYDQIRYHIRQYRNHYNDDRFWRLVAGLSDAYMLKGYFRMFRGTEYDWVLAEVDTDQLTVKAFSGELGDLLKQADYNPAEAGKVIRKLPAEERRKLIDPFDFKRDANPIVVIDNGDELELHDGNRRAVNAAIFEIPSLTAYLGFKSPEGKPAIREDVIADVVKVLNLTEKLDINIMHSVLTVLKVYKEKYINAPQIIDQYLNDHVLPMFEDKKKKILNKNYMIQMINDLLGYDPNKKIEDQKLSSTNGNGKKHRILLNGNGQGLQPS